MKSFNRQEKEKVDSGLFVIKIITWLPEVELLWFNIHINMSAILDASRRHDDVRFKK